METTKEQDTEDDVKWTEWYHVFLCQSRKKLKEDFPNMSEADLERTVLYYIAEKHFEESPNFDKWRKEGRPNYFKTPAYHNCKRCRDFRDIDNENTELKKENEMLKKKIKQCEEEHLGWGIQTPWNGGIYVVTETKEPLEGEIVGYFTSEEEADKYCDPYGRDGKETCEFHESDEECEDHCEKNLIFRHHDYCEKL